MGSAGLSMCICLPIVFIVTLHALLAFKAFLYTTLFWEIRVRRSCDMSWVSFPVDTLNECYQYILQMGLQSGSGPQPSRKPCRQARALFTGWLLGHPMVGWFFVRMEVRFGRAFLGDSTSRCIRWTIHCQKCFFRGLYAHSLVFCHNFCMYATIWCVPNVAYKPISARIVVWWYIMLTRLLCKVFNYYTSAGLAPTYCCSRIHIGVIDVILSRCITLLMVEP